MAKKAKTILGCMKCGSNEFDSDPGAEYAAQTEFGLGGAVSGKVLCKKCGSFGFPLEFDSEKVREEYAKSKTKKR